MSDLKNPILQSVADWIAHLGIRLRVALSARTDDESTPCDCRIDPDFDGWLHNDPAITENPASRYGGHGPGYLTANGRRSLEIGAVDD